MRKFGYHMALVISESDHIKPNKGMPRIAALRCRWLSLATGEPCA